MPVYTKASRARLAARMGFDDEPANPEGDDEDFTLLWRGPSSVPPPSRSSAPPPSRRPRASAAPPPTIDRPTPTQLAPPPPPSFPAPARPEMRAQAAPAHPEPPRIVELKLHERRWRVMVRASLLLAIGCVLGVGTEVLLQHRGGEAMPDPSMTSATVTMPLARPGSESGPLLGNPPTPIAPVATQCVNTAVNGAVNAVPSSPSAAPSAAAADESATAAHALRHHHHHAPDAAQASAGSGATAPIPDGTIAPDDIAAAAEALQKAKQETMLP